MMMDKRDLKKKKEAKKKKLKKVEEAKEKNSGWKSLQLCNFYSIHQ